MMVMLLQVASYFQASRVKKNPVFGLIRLLAIDYQDRSSLSNRWHPLVFFLLVQATTTFGIQLDKLNIPRLEGASLLSTGDAMAARTLQAGADICSQVIQYDTSPSGRKIADQVQVGVDSLWHQLFSADEKVTGGKGDMHAGKYVGWFQINGTIIIIINHPYFCGENTKRKRQQKEQRQTSYRQTVSIATYGGHMEQDTSASKTATMHTTNQSVQNHKSTSSQGDENNHNLSRLRRGDLWRQQRRDKKTTLALLAFNVGTTSGNRRPFEYVFIISIRWLQGKKTGDFYYGGN
ncbi:hypothetical protein BDB00DRAFT_941953 [Zychaea mexicana]|uniref:uncharacterized protein n=1 Tax=Zychaea mexicana TaxID=64656 RepID=UPI0022FE774D|nr:uncharacterized protein BDB00DRAFT_941953 [Zychaea mexicana]KAI9488938.1 hypothetical protein BDB00DRAFT_941953 [Zychaea mexicana]